MNIIKKFEDIDFLYKVYHWRPLGHQDRWFWGLGEDGEVYHQCSLFTDRDVWKNLHENPSIAAKLTLKDMKRIVKEFGHLVIFT